MTIDFSRKLTNLEGDPMMENGQEVTLGMVACGALLAPDDSISGADKVTRYLLATRIHGTAGAVEVSLDEAALIKAVIGRNPYPMVVGRAYELLENGGN